MVIHFQDAPLARRAMVRAIRFPCLALLAKAGSASGFDGERREVPRRFVRGEMRVAATVDVDG